MYTFYKEEDGELGLTVMCGKGRKYQVNLAALELLAMPSDGDAGYDASLVELTQRVNEAFTTLGRKALAAKRKAMQRAGLAGADRLELTVLLTERGIRPAFSIALPRKERAPVPHKSTARQLFGWARPGNTVAWTVEGDAAETAPPAVPRAPRGTAKASAKATRASPRTRRSD